MPHPGLTDQQRKINQEHIAHGELPIWDDNGYHYADTRYSGPTKEDLWTEAKQQEWDAQEADLLAEAEAHAHKMDGAAAEIIDRLINRNRKVKP